MAKSELERQRMLFDMWFSSQMNYYVNLLSLDESAIRKQYESALWIAFLAGNHCEWREGNDMDHSYAARKSVDEQLSIDVSLPDGP